MPSRPEPRKAENAEEAEQRRRNLKAKFARVSRNALGGRRRLSFPVTGGGASTSSGGRRGLSRMEIAIVIGVAVFVVLMAMRVF